MLDPQAPVTEEISNLQGRLRAKLPIEKLQEAQGTEYANIFKAVRKHKDRLAHLYVQNRDGLLYRIIRDNNVKHEALMVPKEMTKIILFEAHEILTHSGQLKMYMFIRRRYFWKNLRRDVNQYVKNCDACNKANCREPKYANFTMSIPKHSMAHIAMDLMGPYLPTTQGNEYILSCMDLLTHFLFLVPIPDKQADTVVTAYTDHVFAEAGGSETILSDRGKEFQAEIFNKVTSELGI